MDCDSIFGEVPPRFRALHLRAKGIGFRVESRRV